MWVGDCVVYGGVCIKVCLVKGVNLVMEYVEVMMYGWIFVIYDFKVDIDVNYLCCLDWVLCFEYIVVVKFGVVGYNFFGIVYVWLFVGECGVWDVVEFEMFFGMV